jgi:multicomponent Na+:H+ antiporter subunit B
VSARVRTVVLFTGLAGLAVLYLCALHGLPGFGHYRGPYGDVINAAGVAERHVTDMVTAVNFDYRGVDTLGEEFILFVSAAGVAVVLRRGREEREREAAGREGEEADEASSRRPPRTSDAVRMVSLLMVAPVVLLGIYIAAHGQLSPGGGFQGGVILATALLLVYLAGSYRRMRRIGPVTLVELAEALGAGGFVLVGLAGVLSGAAFLADVLPLGTTGTLLSGGTITLISALIGLEVGASVVLIATEFLEQALEIRGAERHR